MFAWRRCERKFGPLIAERLSGALSDADADALDRHLKACERCRIEETETRGLVGEIRGAAETGALAHPTPQELAMLSEEAGALPPERKASIESHLETCADCRTEWSVATRWSAARRPAPVATGRPHRTVWTGFAAGAVSTAAAAVLFAVLFLSDDPPGLDQRPGLEVAGAPVQLRGLHHRASGDAMLLPVSSTATAVVVALTVEALPPARLEVELRDDAGRTLEKTELTLEDPSGLVLLSVTSSRLPDSAGEFRVRVAVTGESFRYPFRVERGGD